MNKKTAVVIILAIILSMGTAGTQKNVNPENEDAILLKNAQFDTGKLPAQAAAMSAQAYNSNMGKYYIVQFTGHVQDRWKQQIEDTGAVIHDYVPNNAFIVRMKPSTRSEVEAFEFVQWVGKYDPSYRISPALSELLENQPDDGKEDITILLFDTKDAKYVSEGVADLGCEIVDISDDTIRVKADRSKISEIAYLEGVSWIDRYVQPSIMNDIAANITNVHTVQNTRGLTGIGQTVAMLDTGLDTGVDDSSMHDDLEGRIVGIYDLWDGDPRDLNGHGTHTAGSLAGNGSLSDDQYAGMAPQADIFFQAAGDDTSNIYAPSDLKAVFQEAYNSGARIHSNSWGFGSDLAGTYTSYSKDVDSFMWDNPQMLIVFAAGNHGPDNDTIIPPGTAKNAITVGSSENLRSGVGKSAADNESDIADFSSRGPTDDGRTKPDLVAPGTYIISTRSSLATDIVPFNEYYSYDSGTSMSVPIVSGAATLARQYYIENESTTPSAALIKATLINGAVDLGYPRDVQGWGRLDIERALFTEPPRKIKYHDGISLETSQSWSTKYNITNSTEPLRITLVWTDYPAEPSAAVTLVNDLDLKVTGPEGIYLGNGGDNINNVEQIELETPPVGWYDIEVIGTNVPQGPQPFSLVISGAIKSEPIIIFATAKPSIIEADGIEKTIFTVAVDKPDEIETITMNLSSIGGDVAQPLENMSGLLWHYTTATTELGTFHFDVNATNKEGESNTSRSITLTTVDTTPPTSNTPEDTRFFPNTDTNFTHWKLFDPHPGHYWVLRDEIEIVPPTQWMNGVNITVPVNTTMGNGLYNYTIQYNDSSGNMGAQDTVNITIVNTTAPEASNESPVNSSYISSNNISISVDITDYEPGVNESSIFMSVNGIEVDTIRAPIPGGFRVSNNTSLEISHGQSVDVVVKASDEVNNHMKYEWSFATDQEVPTLEISSPADGHSTTSDTITISGNFDGTGSPAALTINGVESAYGNGGSFIGEAQLSVGINTIYANVTDSAGNSNNAYINVTRYAASTSSTGGGGGGGGGGGTTGEDYENIQLKDISKEYVNKDSTISFTFKNPENDILYINYEALTNAGHITTTIEELKYRSNFVKMDPEGIIYKYINIWVGKAGYATKRKIQDPVIGFRVEKEWIDENNIDSDSIKLNRYYDDIWTELPTTKIDEDNNYFYFESKTTGFSPFVITGEEYVFRSTASMDTEIRDEMTDVAAQVGTNSMESPMLSWVFVLMIISGTCLYMRKKI